MKCSSTPKKFKHRWLTITRIFYCLGEQPELVGNVPQRAGPRGAHGGGRMPRRGLLGARPAPHHQHVGPAVVAALRLLHLSQLPVAVVAALHRAELLQVDRSKGFYFFGISSWKFFIWCRLCIRIMMEYSAGFVKRSNFTSSSVNVSQVGPNVN